MVPLVHAVIVPLPLDPLIPLPIQSVCLVSIKSVNSVSQSSHKRLPNSVPPMILEGGIYRKVNKGGSEVGPFASETRKLGFRR